MSAEGAENRAEHLRIMLGHARAKMAGFAPDAPELWVRTTRQSIANYERGIAEMEARIATINSVLVEG